MDSRLQFAKKIDFSFFINLISIKNQLNIGYDERNSPVSDRSRTIVILTMILKRQFLSSLTLLPLIALIFVFPTITHASGGTRLVIPDAGIDQAVVHAPLRQFPGGVVTWDVSGIGARVGYFEGTAWFGTGGNTIAGVHSEFEDGTDTTGALLYDVEVGDGLVVHDDGAELYYQISEIKIVGASDLSVLSQTAHDQITLMTCHIPSLQAGIYLERLIVIAVRVS